jgi:hypothetical protein
MGRLGIRAAVGWFVLPLGVCACSSISASIQSVSNSVYGALGSVSDAVKSVSGSGGKSGGSADAGARYRTDLCAYTRSCFSEEEQVGESGDFVRELGRIAELHGVTDWEGDANTAAAFRETIARGALGEAGLARLRRDLEPLGPHWLDAALTATTATTSTTFTTATTPPTTVVETASAAAADR